VNAVNFDRKHSQLTFLAVCAVLAAVGCSDEGTTPLNQGTAGSTAAGSTAAGSTAAGSTAAGSTAAGSTAAGATAAGMGAAGMATATAGTMGTATAGTGTTATAGTGATAMAGTGAMMPAGAAPTLQNVYDMIYQSGGNCAVCHGMAPKDGTNGNLGDIRGGKQAFFDALVSKPAKGTQCMGKGMYIVPGKPAESLLYQKVSEAMPPCGVQMPVGGMLMPAELKLLSDWITAGALNN
jgi:hypothetical protein